MGDRPAVLSCPSRSLVLSLCALLPYAHAWPRNAHRRAAQPSTPPPANGSSGLVAAALLVAALTVVVSGAWITKRRLGRSKERAFSSSTEPRKPRTPHKICIVGSGNLGSAISRVVGRNAAEDPDLDDAVSMWVYEENIKGVKLTDIINTDHVNVKYLPGILLPHNVVAVPELSRAAEGATLLILVLPHQFLSRLCPEILQVVAPSCRAISLIKGVNFRDHTPRLLSNTISSHLGGMEVAVLMGANGANEVARDEFCEATIGCANLDSGKVWRACFHRPSFNVTVVSDVASVEMCGALKNVIALGAGFSDGIGFGANTKAAIVRLGLREMQAFCALFFPEVRNDTFFESCGVADLITTCYDGRNRKCAEAFARRSPSVTWEEIEAELLNGQKLQGTLTCQEVHACLVSKGEKSRARFPLMETIYAISFERCCPRAIVQIIDSTMSEPLRTRDSNG